VLVLFMATNLGFSEQGTTTSMATPMARCPGAVAQAFISFQAVARRYLRTMFRKRVVRSFACFCMALLLGVLLPMDLYHQCSHDHGVLEHADDGGAGVVELDECGLCDLLAPVFHPQVMFSTVPLATDGIDRVVAYTVEPKVADKDTGTVRGPPNQGPYSPVLLLRAA